MSISRYEKSSTILEGQTLRPSPPPQEEGGAMVTIPATGGGALRLSAGVMSKHLLAVGSIGSGKSTCLFHIVRSLADGLRPMDRMIIFDAKGDYVDRFLGPKDLVLGSVTGENNRVWNIFTDLMDTPQSEPNADLLRQMATTLFSRQIETSNNPTFPCGARDLFIGLTLAFVRRARAAGSASWQTLNNKTLKDFFTGEVSDPTRIGDLIAPYPDLQWLRMYILAPQSATTQSYLAPLQAMVNEMFIGCFAQAGDFSIRRFVMGSDEGKLFISYDAEYGCMMDAMYTVLFDLAMRQSIGRSARRGGNIIFVMDELPLIPALAYLDQVLNFGRSLGVKMVAGIQNVNQMENKYGESQAASILSGFSTFFCFHLFDEASRDLVKQRHGTNLRRISCMKNNGTDEVDILQSMQVIEDWDISSLYGGRCIVSLPTGDPFFFHPTDYPFTSGALSPALPGRAPSGPQPNTGRIVIKNITRR